MKIETITYKQIKNLGNYQSETLEMTAIVDENEDPALAAADLKSLVLSQLYPVETSDNEPDPDNIPFKSGDAAKDSGIPDGF